MASLKLTERFIKGLQNYNISFDEIKAGKFRYCGGNMNRHLNYYNLLYPDKDLPPLEDNCICGHHINENCYITDGKQTLVLGNCCIKKFIPKSSRTCEICGDSHRNRVVNKCNECRMGICDICSKPCNPLYKKCYNCAF